MRYHGGGRGVLREVDDRISPGGSGPCINEGRYLPQPIALPDNERAVQLTAGARHYCVRTDQGMMYCWGYNNVGQIGLGGGEAVNAIRVAP